VTRIKKNRTSRIRHAPEINSRSGLLNFIDKYSTDTRTILKFGTGSTTAGYIYYLKSDETWDLADATTNLSGSDRVVALALGSSPTTSGMLLRGTTTAIAGILSPSSGKALYLSTTAGYLTTVAPTGSAEIVRVGGHCLDSTRIYFNPEPGWLELV
jgi:hypothetical protein